jgi:isoleucyl-tRNA synthetase
MSYSDFPASPQELEEGLLELWRKEDLFQATLDATAEGEPFVFYEGPPTANGRPGLHHIISRAIKDLVCRYRTMQGRSVTRIAGWDTHGLPVEIEAEKRLGISGKPEIEALGIAEFNRACRESVFTYKEEWEQLSERIAYWLDYSRPYVTFHSTYIESVWWVLKRFADEGLLYRGHKSVPYCPRCGTALSSHEVAQGYEDVEDPSLTFLVPVLDAEGEPDGRFFAVWTTTPWTVPSNVGLAVHPDLTYVEVEAKGRTLIMARDRVEAVLGESAVIGAEMSGSALAGLSYGRPVDLVDEPTERGNAWTVVLEDFVSADDGTGIVHMAPAFGADDYAAGLRHDLPLMRPIDDAGVFLPNVRLIGGLFVKDADSIVVAELERTDLLWRHEMKMHSYPHCWRCRSPLIYMARDSWFAATSTRKDQMLANNEQVSWYPPEVGEKRFGEWLRGNVDWALSRDRYWGTPLPAWVCEADPDHVTWVGSFAELAEHAGPLGDDFDPHRPFIDDVTWTCPCGGAMRRAAGVVDVWFDSGCVPYAQWHYPFENNAEFEAHFPADFICEGLDQTRGWFYSLMAISTLLGRGPAFRNVVVNDLILDGEGQKMSKSRGNAVNPWDAVADHGADAVRWYLMTVSNPWVPKRYDSDGVREASRRFFDTVANTYRFFALYASIEGWQPSDADPAPQDRPVLDRWLLSRLEALTTTVGTELDGYQPTRAYREVIDFVDALSNWYVRRSRQRFWGNAGPDAARAAFRTLHEVLTELARLVAPVVPFIADWLHRALTGRSVHLEAFPVSDPSRRDEGLELEMSAARTLVSLGRAAREEVKIRVRQPLRRLQAVVPADRRPREEILDVVRSELNVKDIEFVGSAEGLVRLEARPNFRALGPRFGKETNAAANAIRGLSGDALAAYRAGDSVSFEFAGEAHVLEAGDLEVVEAAQGDWVVRSENGHVAALDPTLDDELRAEGVARELINRIQRLRKDTGLEVTDRIRLGVFGPDAVRGPAEVWRDFIGGETLCSDMVVGDRAMGDWEGTSDVDLDGVPVHLALSRVKAVAP